MANTSNAANAFTRFESAAIQGVTETAADAVPTANIETRSSATSLALAGGDAAGETSSGIDGRGAKARVLLRRQLGDEVFSSWFNSMELESFDGETLRITFPTKFLRNWVQSHYVDKLTECCASEFQGLKTVEIELRQPGTITARPAMELPLREARSEPATTATPSSPPLPRPAGAPARPAGPQPGRTYVGGFEGSPLDPKYTLDSFVVGPSNRMAHAGATQVAETVRAGATSSINPLFIHAQVGLGKTHLLHAIAWEVQRRAPSTQVLYLTAERFRYQFVEALKSSEPLAFKDKFRSIDILLIDDLEFLHGTATETEFDHIINSLLDGGRQVVVASARPPSQMERLNDRMRSRLQRGLVAEIGALDSELRLKVLERRMQEKRQLDPSFEIGRDVLVQLADQITESGRELEGVMTRLHATWQYMRQPITMDVAEQAIRDLLHGQEPRRIKIDEILKVISRHYGVSKSDLLSERRHRSVVWPRQIGMYLAKQLTSRSLPEIGRRFGGRDHTTVLHAIRKIESHLAGNPRLKDELEEIKKLLGQ
jgi:chromosomal replication initiator protein